MTCLTYAALSWIHKYALLFLPTTQSTTMHLILTFKACNNHPLLELFNRGIDLTLTFHFMLDCDGSREQ